MVLQNLYILIIIKDALTDMQVTYVMCIYSQISLQILAFKLCAYS